MLITVIFQRIWKIFEVLRRKPLKLEVIGGVLLLLSFTLQNYLYDHYDEQEKEIRQGMTNRIIIDKGSNIYENLYFSANSCNGKYSDKAVENYRKQFIQQAAIKNSYGLSFQVNFAESLSKEKKDSVSKQLEQLAIGVTDIDSFSHYIASSDTIMQKIESPVVVLSRITTKRTFVRHVFLILNILGSIVLIYGRWLDKKQEICQQRTQPHTAKPRK
jgi:hypothetical protein